MLWSELGSALFLRKRFVFNWFRIYLYFLGSARRSGSSWWQIVYVWFLSFGCAHKRSRYWFTLRCTSTRWPQRILQKFLSNVVRGLFFRHLFYAAMMRYILSWTPNRRHVLIAILSCTLFKVVWFFEKWNASECIRQVFTARFSGRECDWLACRWRRVCSIDQASLSWHWYWHFVCTSGIKRSSRWSRTCRRQHFAKLGRKEYPIIER